jgi:hypothetical protein
MKQNKHEFDVVVAGGGPSGVAAALSSARAGARTALIEATACLGGMATNGLVPVFNPFSNGRIAVIRGIGLEVVRKLRARGSGLLKPDPLPNEMPEYDWTGLDAEKLKTLLDDLAVEAGVVTRFFTQATEPIRRGRRVVALRTWSKSGPEEWRAKVFVDATGDADVAARAGCPFEKGDEHGLMQPSTVCFVIAGITPAAGRKIRHKPGFAPFLRAASEAGKLSNKLDHHYCLNAVHSGAVAIGCNYKHELDTDGLDAASLSRAIQEGRRLAHELCAFLRREVPGCQNAFVSSSANLVGIRETRRIIGEYRMGLDHFFARRKSPDDIADYANEIDVHVVGRSGADIRKRRHAAIDAHLVPGEHYGIPFRALIPKGVSNLLVAGRAISCDRIMHGSVRPMPACFATGEAAGLAAAMAARSGNGIIRDVDVRQLQDGLLRQGAFIDLAGRK